MSSDVFPCKYCQSDLNKSNVIGALVVCNRCHGTFKLNEVPGKAVPKYVKIIASIVLLGGIGFGAKAMGLFEDKNTKLEKAVAQMPLESALAVRNECLKVANTQCLETVYRRLVELDPNDVSFRANYGFVLTTLKKHPEAILIYEKIVAEGQGTFDLMAYYATSLDATGDTGKAIEWYTRALSINPRLLDVTQQLSVAMTKNKQHYEAVSLLEAFIAKYPEAEGSLKGNLVSIQSQVQALPPAEPAQKMRLLTLRGYHYFLPIRFSEGSAAVSFLVDTGASHLTMKTADVSKAFPESYQKARPVISVLADGRKVAAKLSLLPEIQVGLWKLKNVPVVSCDDCVNLVGMTVLSRFTMKTTPNGELETMELSLAK